MNDEIYHSPLVTRYASKEMARIFSPKTKYTLWRKLWIALAEGQKELGAPISDEMLIEMRAQLSYFDWEKIKKYEKETKHDVMAHIKAFSDLCPRAASIIHLGATSAFVQDNGELCQMWEALLLIEQKLLRLLKHLTDFSNSHRSLACLSYTHLQAAQPTTMGKRASLWLQDFLFDFTDLEYRKNGFQFLGIKGATGGQGALKTVIDDPQKLDQLVAKKMGFKALFTVTSQTYPRKQDSHILDLCSQIAISAHKCATDLRLLAHLNEVEEPFDETQVGSSAMPHKRNPIRLERVCALSRFVIALADNPRYTAALQWLERSLDDSANKRITIPEAFLACDGILELLNFIIPRLHIYPKMIEKNLKKELPLLALEMILTAGVKKGRDRGPFHEELRKKAYTHKERIKNGEEGDFLEELLQDPSFPITRKELKELIKVENFIGNAPFQVTSFLEEKLFPILEKRNLVDSSSFSIEV